MKDLNHERAGMRFSIAQQRKAGQVPSLVFYWPSCCALSVLLGVPHEIVKVWLLKYGRMTS